MKKLMLLGAISVSMFMGVAFASPSGGQGNVIHNHNNNKNLNVGINKNKNSNRNNNSSNSVALSGSRSNVSNSGNSRNFNKSYSQGGNATGGSANQGQSQGQSLNNTTTGVESGAIAISDNSSIVYKARKRNPVNTAYTTLTVSQDVCHGSSSVGGQGITLGLSFSTTWQDDDCILRKDARFIHNTGRSDIALSLMCSKPSVLEAVRRAGTDAEKRHCGLLDDDHVVVTTPVIIEERHDVWEEEENEYGEAG